MQLTREINRVLVAILIAFAALTISAGYWAIFGPESILQREDNPRLFEAEASILRGDIIDRRGNLLATSIASENGAVVRQYLHPETASLTGYYSQRYGAGGAEEAYNAILRGDNLVSDVSTAILSQLFHRPQSGSDVRLTIDLDVQQRIVQAMNDRTGAVVVLAVPSGEVLGLVSVPTYDPNTLDQNWEMLAQAPGNVFFNRAVQGNYQPGGMLQTPLIAAALLDNQPLENTVSNATTPFDLDDLSLNCAVRLPFDDLTLRDAYAFACPQPFVQLAQELGTSKVQTVLTTFHFDQPPMLQGFTPPSGSNQQTVDAITISEENLTKAALGQGLLNVTPLEMATMTAAIINDGNAPNPYTLMQTRSPDAQQWASVQAVRPTIPYTTANTARQLQDLMRNAVANGAASNAGRPNIDIGGHATIAYSGDASQAWFIGFATIGGRQAVAVAVVIENSADPGLAADIGGTALAAAHQALQLQ